MKPITITRRLTFCAGHRVYMHESKCKHMHGHNYVAMLTCSAPELDAIGRVIDFSVIKAYVGTWLDTMWDHAFIVCAQDLEVLEALVKLNHKHYVMQDNPTAENMCKELMRNAQTLLPKDITIEKVGIWETENCYAEVCR